MLEQPTTYETTLGRASLALGIGAVLGTSITFLGQIMFVIVVKMVTHESVPWNQFFDSLSLLIIIAIFGVYMIGLFIIAAPIWWFLHGRGLRSARHALMFGAIAAFCVRLAMDIIPSLLFPIDGYSAGDSGGSTVINGRPTLHGWIETFQTAVITAGIAAIVALVIWRIAYRQVRQ